jgi:hypothetical protein
MKTKVRNPYAIIATFRSGAGPHKDSRKGRGGSRNEQVDLLSEYEDELELATSGSHATDSVVESV